MTTDRTPRPRSAASTPHVPLLRLRLKKGQVEVVRLLSESYKGLLTHFVDKRSEYCPGPDTCRLHKLKAVWKGYCSVEAYDQAANLWIPWVLEITESLDQDFWGIFRRGQVWELRHEIKKREGGGPRVFGTRWEDCDPYTLPEPYDMRPVLIATYHTEDVRLTLDNPMPRRPMLQPSRAAPPKRLAADAEGPKEIDPEILEQLRQRARRAAEPHANGRDK